MTSVIYDVSLIIKLGALCLILTVVITGMELALIGILRQDVIGNVITSPVQ